MLAFCPDLIDRVQAGSRTAEQGLLMCARQLKHTPSQGVLPSIQALLGDRRGRATAEALLGRACFVPDALPSHWPQMSNTTANPCLFGPESPIIRYTTEYL